MRPRCREEAIASSAATRCTASRSAMVWTIAIWQHGTRSRRRTRSMSVASFAFPRRPRDMRLQMRLRRRGRQQARLSRRPRVRRSNRQRQRNRRPHHSRTWPRRAPPRRRRIHRLRRPHRAPVRRSRVRLPLCLQQQVRNLRALCQPRHPYRLRHRRQVRVRSTGAGLRMARLSAHMSVAIRPGKASISRARQAIRCGLPQTAPLSTAATA